MADEIDVANDYAQRANDAAAATVRAAAALIPAGNAGDCDLCGEWSGRLVGGICAPCRDLRGLP
jgi:hypothetical protein